MQSLKVAIIQSDIVANNKEQNYINFAKKIKQVVGNVDLIILPEMFNTGFIMDLNISASSQDDVLAWMYQQIEGTNTAIVGSAAIFSANNMVANRLLFVTGDKNVDVYDKSHLFRHAGEHKKYSQGHERKIIEYKGFKILLSVCFDLRFPVFNCNNNDYDVLINVASWPSSRREHWMALLKARAIENQVYVLACNRVGQDSNLLDYSGDSCVIDFNGDVIHHNNNDETILISILDKELQLEHRKRFNFLESQDSFTLKM